MSKSNSKTVAAPGTNPDRLHKALVTGVNFCFNPITDEEGERIVQWVYDNWPPNRKMDWVVMHRVSIDPEFWVLEMAVGGETVAAITSMYGGSMVGTTNCDAALGPRYWGPLAYTVSTERREVEVANPPPRRKWMSRSRPWA